MTTRDRLESSWVHISHTLCLYQGLTVKKTFVYALHTAQDNSNWKQNVTYALDPHLQEQRYILVNTFSCSRSRGSSGAPTLVSSYGVHLHSSGSEEPPAPSGARFAYRAHRALAESWTGDVRESVFQVQANVGNANAKADLSTELHFLPTGDKLPQSSLHHGSRWEWEGLNDTW